MTAASLFFAIGYIPVRELSPKFTAYEMVFYRSLITVVAMLPWIARVGLGRLRTRRWLLHGSRAVLTYAGMVCLFYGIANMPRADATALLFTAPLFTVVIAGWTLGDPIGARRSLAIMAGFAGALIVIRPGVVEISWPMLAVMFTALAYGTGSAATRALALTEDPNAVVFYMFALMLPIGIGPALYFAAVPTWAEAGWLLLLGVSTFFSQQCLTRSYVEATAAVVTPAFYLQLPIIAALAFVLYGEEPAVWVWLGGAVIAAAACFIVRIERRYSSASIRAMSASEKPK
jgi:S-adenosylmethionine uptake transporter